MNLKTLRLNPFCKRLASAILLGFAGAAHASAHAFLEQTNPVVGSTIKQAPAEVRLRYTQGLEPTFSRVTVLDSSGHEVDKGDAHLDPKNDRLMIVSLPPGLAPGRYKVVWRVVSVDTHPTEGNFTFVVAP